MSYFPWLAGGALAGYLGSRGMAQHRRGQQARRPFPLPPMLKLHEVKLGAWKAIPAQTKDRWENIYKVYRVEGPQKGLSLWHYKPKSWPVSGLVAIRLKKGNKYVGHVALEEARKGGQTVWIVTKSYLDEPYRGIGLGSLMYVAARDMLEAKTFGPVKMISNADYVGSGTSPMAQKVWDRQREAGRLNIGTSDHTDERLFRPAPWPGPTDATDVYCPVHDEHYSKFKTGITRKQAEAALAREHDVAYLAAHGVQGTAKASDVMRYMGKLKRDLWRQRHAGCLLDRDEQWEMEQDYYHRQADPQDPSTWRWERDDSLRDKDLICLTDKREGPKCFVGTRRRPSGKVNPPHGGSKCRSKRSGRYKRCK